MVTDIWNINQYRTELPLPMFFVEQRSAPDKKNTFNIRQYEIQFKMPKHKGCCSVFKLQRYGHSRNYCHLKPSCVECAIDNLTNQCHRKERSSDVRCVLCGGSHSVIYKGCTVHNRKHNHLTIWKYTLHTQLGVTYAQTTERNSYAPTSIEQEPHINQSHQHFSNIQELKKDEKHFWSNGNYAKPPHNRA
jgi:hypothetical protein